MTGTVTERIDVIDVDSHICEPPDTWTSRLPSKYQDIAPRVVNMNTGPGGADEEVWVIGDQPIMAAWQLAMAGWPELYPGHPGHQSEADPAAWDPVARLKTLDEHGVSAQVLYPNVLAFYARSMLAVGDAEFHLASVRAYNDFLTDFVNTDSSRYAGITLLPFWDVDASVKELERCAEAGHRGVLFLNAPQKVDLPVLADKHWDKLFSAAEANKMSINFHVAASTADPAMVAAMAPDNKEIQLTTTDTVMATVAQLMSNAGAITEVIISGLCDRYPNLDFVSVESGYGYVPYLLEALDWQWLNNGAHKEFPNRLMPSEYFRRQVYGTFWFENQSLQRLVDLYPDNLMFETDFPHPTCLAPGPASYTDSAKVVLENNMTDVPEDILKKILRDNAARVYRLG
jgi:predicted TIM-barrel fold metal-dependent hydrolase